MNPVSAHASNGRNSAGLDLWIDGQNGVIRVPESGSLTFEPGEKYRDCERLTNWSETPGKCLCLSIHTHKTTEGAQNPETELNRNLANGGEFDDHLSIRVWLTQSGEVIGYFFGGTNSYLPYSGAAHRPPTCLSLPTSLTRTNAPRTSFCFELCYPTVVRDTLGDTLAFDLELTRYPPFLYAHPEWVVTSDSLNEQPPCDSVVNEKYVPHFAKIFLLYLLSLYLGYCWFLPSEMWLLVLSGSFGIIVRHFERPLTRILFGKNWPDCS